MLSLAVVGRTAIFSSQLPVGRPVCLGRGEQCDIRIDDRRVSRAHACVVQRGDRVETST